MKNHTKSAPNDHENLAEQARDLLSATADVAGEKVEQARKRLSAVLESAKETGVRMKESAVAGAKITDKAVREHPYQAIGIAVGVGALLGYLIAKRSSRSSD